jgi:protein-S-isoprenylcysteine O-methyltransferase Ste14
MSVETVFQFVHYFTGACVAALLTAVIFNFINSNKGQAKEKKSIVATFTMLLFMLLVVLAVFFRQGVIAFSDDVKIVLMVSGAAIVLLSTIFNILGRLMLGKHWANQIKIYKDQKLLRKGVFGIVRHPLYASLMWFLVGVAMIYQSWLVLLLNFAIFVPMMHYRAKQEELMLGKEFKDYKKYKKEVGMFFPKIK